MVTKQGELPVIIKKKEKIIENYTTTQHLILKQVKLNNNIQWILNSV